MRRNEAPGYYLGRIEAVEDYVYDHPNYDPDVILSILNICRPKRREIDVVTFTDAEEKKR